jgi:acetylornithine deacetylase
VVGEQEAWLAGVIERNRGAFARRPETGYHIRWLAPTAMDPAHPLVISLAGSVSQVAHRTPAVVGAPYACDLFALQQFFNMPAVVFGPRGGNAHAGDEYLDLSTLLDFWECLLVFVMEWCGAA